jgi:hypothetical protein
VGLAQAQALNIGHRTLRELKGRYKVVPETWKEETPEGCVGLKVVLPWPLAVTLRRRDPSGWYVVTPEVLERPPGNGVLVFTDKDFSRLEVKIRAWPDEHWFMKRWYIGSAYTFMPMEEGTVCIPHAWARMGLLKAGCRCNAWGAGDRIRIFPVKQD